MMGMVPVKRVLLLIILLTVGICSGSSYAADIHEKIGNRVDLKGTALNTDSIYLFVTGPGLPSDGVRLDAMKVPVITGDPASFTVTDVNNDRWEYSWNTARQGFSLKEGIYTVYAAKKPIGKSSVNSAVYGTITVSLTNSGEPYQSFGTVVLNTTPVVSEIFIDNIGVGNTPQTRAVAEGDHEIRFERPGYQTIVEKISVSAGSFSSVERVMSPGLQQTQVPVFTTVTPVITSPTIPVTGVVPPATKAGAMPAPLVLSTVFVVFIGPWIIKKR